MFALRATVIAVTLTILSIYWLTPLAMRIGLVDQPGGRKLHQGQIPLIGGIAMFIGFSFGLLSLDNSLGAYRSFMAGAALLIAVGILDDFHEISPRSRLIAQLLAGLLMTCWGNNVVSNLGELWLRGPFSLGQWGIPFTVVAVMGIINAINMLDGMDGFAGGLSLVTTGALLILAVKQGLSLDAHILTVLLAVIATFLLFNFPFPGRQQAKVFMGDAGSMLLGFALVWFLVSLSQGNGAVASPVTMLWLIAVPLWDSTNVLLRRLWQRTSPFKADRNHLQHLLHAMGYNALPASLLVMGLASVCAGIGLWGDYRQIPDAWLFWGFIALFMVYTGVFHWAWTRMAKMERS